MVNAVIILKNLIILENLKKEKDVGRENLKVKMKIMKENLKMIKNMVLEYLLKRVNIHIIIMGNFRKIYLFVKYFIYK